MEGKESDQMLNCRHGLVLIFRGDECRFLVWDPVTVVRYCIDPPPAKVLSARVNGAVLRDATVGDHFKVVLVAVEGPRAIACVYSSETRDWGNPISTPLPPKASTGGPPAMGISKMHSLLVENSLYWLLFDKPTSLTEAFTRVPRSSSILEFDMERKSLTVTRLPGDLNYNRGHEISVVTEKGGGLGLLTLSGCNAHLWKRNHEHDGDTPWVLGRTIELGNLLSLNPHKDAGNISIQGFAEYNHVVVLSTRSYLYTVQLETLEVKQLGNVYHAFESVYTTGSASVPRRMVIDCHCCVKTVNTNICKFILQ